jgi:hypothetical protein
MKYISLPLFIISFSIGVLHAYLNAPKKQVVFVYPTADNINNLQYRDKADICFNISANKTNCKDMFGIDRHNKIKIQG